MKRNPNVPTSPELANNSTLGIAIYWEQEFQILLWKIASQTDPANSSTTCSCTR